MQILTHNELTTEAVSDLHEIGHKIKQRRTEQGLSVYELAKRAGVTEHTVHRAEKGSNANVTTLSKILRILGGRVSAISIW